MAGMSGDGYDVLCRAAFEAWREHDGNKAEAARSLGWPRTVLRDRLFAYFETHLEDWPDIEVPPGYRINSRSVRLDENGNVKAEFIKVTKAPDEAKFVIPEGHAVKGVSALVDEQGRTIQQWVKTREDQRSIEQFAEAMEKAASSYAGLAAPIRTHPEIAERADPDLLNIHLYPDLHMGLSTKLTQTGSAWDLKVADRTYRKLSRLLTERAAFAQTGVLLYGGDTLHYDDPMKATRRSGNRLSGPMDYTYPEVLSATQLLAVYQIELAMQKYETVEVRVLEGNHDPDSSVAIAHFLAAWFRNEPKVRIDTDDSIYWFWEHGKCMFGATHGHECKIDKMPGVMAADEPEMWGRTQHRFAFGFHIHHGTKSTGSEGGAKWETFETPVPLDKHHFDKGYRSNRSLLVRTYHVERGMTGETTEMIV